MEVVTGDALPAVTAGELFFPAQGRGHAAGKTHRRRVFRKTLLQPGAGLRKQPLRQGQAHQHVDDGDQQETAQQLGRQKLPAQQGIDQDAQFEHQIGGGEAENERGLG